MASASDLPLEAAFMKLRSAFQANGIDLPPNLELLLRTYGPPTEGGHEAGRKALYKRLYGILWYGSGKTIGAGLKAGGRNPTYVYPSALKMVVRARFPQAIKDLDDPVGAQVYHLTYEDLGKTKWPATKKSRRITHE